MNRKARTRLAKQTASSRDMRTPPWSCLLKYRIAGILTASLSHARPTARLHLTTLTLRRPCVVSEPQLSVVRCQNLKGRHHAAQTLRLDISIRLDSASLRPGVSALYVSLYLHGEEPACGQEGSRLDAGRALRRFSGCEGRFRQG